MIVFDSVSLGDQLSIQFSHALCRKRCTHCARSAAETEIPGRQEVDFRSGSNQTLRRLERNEKRLPCDLESRTSEVMSAMLLPDQLLLAIYLPQGMGHRPSA
jgi:wyosine [tRNA(Phe)-imidazoG37] synthetase (radical SAM superfamily)